MESAVPEVKEKANADRCMYEVELGTYLGHLSEHDPVVVAFDDSLWLRNSTEAFLSNVKPSMWVSFWLQLLELLISSFGSAQNGRTQSQDWLRVLIVVIVAPWSIFQWRNVTTIQAAKHLNGELRQTLERSNQPVVIVSSGFRFVIEPMLKSLNIAWPLVVAGDLNIASRLRKDGKGVAVVRLLGLEVVRRGLFIGCRHTDSDIFEMTRYSVQMGCSKVSTRQIGLKPMLPFVYLKKVKRPYENYFTRVILGHDYFLLLLTFSLASSTPWASAASLLLFVLSYFTAYEIGYHENDRLGLIYEAKPKVSQAYRELGQNYVPYVAWVCAGIFALPASILATQTQDLNQEYGPDVLFIEVWLVFMAFLLGVRVVFAWFNRLPEVGRIVPMLILQLARSAGYLFIFTTSVVGVLFCVSHALSKWIPYIVYRCGGSRKFCPNHLLNAMLLLCFLLIQSAISGFTSIWTTWHTLVICGYSLLRAAIELRQFIHYFKLHREPVEQENN